MGRVVAHDDRSRASWSAGGGARAYPRVGRQQRVRGAGARRGTRARRAVEPGMKPPPVTFPAIPPIGGATMAALTSSKTSKLSSNEPKTVDGKATLVIPLGPLLVGGIGKRKMPLGSTPTVVHIVGVIVEVLMAGAKSTGVAVLVAGVN